MVDVEQDALRALEQDPPAAPSGLVEVAPYRPRERQYELGDFGEVVLEPLAIDRWLAEAGAQGIMVRAQAVEQRVEFVEMGEIAHADGAAADLVLIGRADAAAGGADLARARRILAQCVEIAVDRQDQRAGFGDIEAVRD